VKIELFRADGHHQASSTLFKLVRKLTHNLLKHEATLKRGIKTKRLVAARDRKYLLKILIVKASFD